MQKELHLQEKGLELFLYHEGKGKIPLKSLRPWMLLAMQAFEQFLFEGQLAPIVKEYKLESITFNVEICDEQRIQELNNEYRDKDKVTDVLSFGSQDDFRNRQADIFIPELELGDIFICEEVCIRQASEFDISEEEEFVHLLVHGFLHLCGYDHELSEREEQLMESLERELLDKISSLK